MWRSADAELKYHLAALPIATTQAGKGLLPVRQAEPVSDQEPGPDEPGVQQPDNVAPGRRGIGEAAQQRQVVVDNVVDGERHGLTVWWQAKEQDSASAPGCRDRGPGR